MEYGNAELFWDQLYEICGKIDINNIDISSVYHPYNIDLENSPSFVGREEAFKSFGEYLQKRVEKTKTSVESKEIGLIASYGCSGSGKTRFLQELMMKLENVTNNFNFKDDTKSYYNQTFSDESIRLAITYNSSHGFLDKDLDYDALCGFCWRLIVPFLCPNDGTKQQKMLRLIMIHTSNYLELMSLFETIDLIYKHPLIKQEYTYPMFVAVDEILKVNDVDEISRHHPSIDGLILKPYHQILSAIGNYYDLCHPNYGSYNVELRNRPFVVFMVSSLFGAGLAKYKSLSNRLFDRIPLDTLKKDEYLQIFQSRDWFLNLSPDAKQYLYYFVSLSNGFPSQLTLIYQYFNNNEGNLKLLEENAKECGQAIWPLLKQNAKEKSELFIQKISKSNNDNPFSLIQLLSKNVNEENFDDVYNGYNAYNLFVEASFKVEFGRLIIPPSLLMYLLEYYEKQWIQNEHITFFSHLLNRLYPQCELKGIGDIWEDYIISYEMMHSHLLSYNEPISIIDYFKNADIVYNDSNDSNSLLFNKYIFHPLIDSKKSQYIGENNQIQQDYENNKYFMYSSHLQNHPAIDYAFVITDNDSRQPLLYCGQPKTTESDNVFGRRKSKNVFPAIVRLLDVQRDFIGATKEDSIKKYMNRCWKQEDNFQKLLRDHSKPFNAKFGSKKQWQSIVVIHSFREIAPEFNDTLPNKLPFNCIFVKSSSYSSSQDHQCWIHPQFTAFPEWIQGMKSVIKSKKEKKKSESMTDKTIKSSYASWGIEQLKQECKQRGLRSYKALTKEKLIEKLTKSDHKASCKL